MHPDSRSMRERLVDERALALAAIPGYMLEQTPAPPSIRYGVPPADRFAHKARAAIGITDILVLGERELTEGSYQGSSRPSHGQY